MDKYDMEARERARSERTLLAELGLRAFDALAVENDTYWASYASRVFHLTMLFIMRVWNAR
jgi:hypothetical protein